MAIVNQASRSGIGQAIKASPIAAAGSQGTSLQTFVSSLIVSMAIFAVEITVFVVLRSRYKDL